MSDVAAWNKFQKLAVCTALCIQSFVLAEPTLDPPDWYESNRVQAHTEHKLDAALRMTPQAHADAVKALGAGALCRIYLDRDEGAWWQSSVGEIHPLIGGREFAREISDAVHAAGLKCIAYYRHMSDAWVQRERPEWLCLLPNGQRMLEPRGKTDNTFVPCLNSPYREYIKTRLLELVDRGVDGFYLDNAHMPDVCTGEWCRGLFTHRYGHGMNVTAEPGSADYLEMVSFINNSMVEAFAEWQSAVTKANPDVFILVKTSKYPLFITPHMNTELLRNAIVVGTEFNKNFGSNPGRLKNVDDFSIPSYDDQLALAWSIVRDGAQGRPPHMWIPHIQTEIAARYSIAAAVSYGCVAAPNIRLHDLSKDTPNAMDVFSSSFEMGRLISPYLDKARPLPIAALHISERVRNKHLRDVDNMWPAFFSPAMGGYRALKEQHVPWVVISDLELSKGIDERTSLLVLPWPAELTLQEHASVEKFMQRGGQVLKLEPSAGWHLKRKLPKLERETNSFVRKVANTIPIQIEGSKAIHAVSYHQPEQNRLVICLMNSWDWLRLIREPDPATSIGKQPPPCEGMQITLSGVWANPVSAFDALTNTKLTLLKDSQQARLSVPQFQINAFVIIQY